MPLNAIRDAVLEYSTECTGGTPANAAFPFGIIASGTGAGATQINSAHPYYGILSLNTGTVATNYCLMNLDPTSFLMNNQPFHSVVKFQIPTLSVAGTNGFITTIGFDNGITGASTITNGARLRIDHSNNILTEVYSGGVAVGGPNTEVPFAGGLVAGTWYNAIMDVGFVNTASWLTYTTVGGPTVGVRFYLGIDTGTNVPVAPVFMGEYPVSILPTANTGFIIGITQDSGTLSRSLLIDRAYVSAGRLLT